MTHPPLVLIAGFLVALLLGGACVRLARRRPRGGGLLRWSGVALAALVAAVWEWNAGALLAVLVLGIWAGMQQARASELPHPD